MNRFSDEKLAEFHQEFKDHVEKYEERLAQETARFDQLVKAQEQNTEAIGILIRETRDIVQVYRDLQGAVRIGTSVQKLLVWLAKWGAAGTVVAATVNWGGQVLESIIKSVGAK